MNDSSEYGKSSRSGFSGMDLQKALEYLEDLAERLGVEIIYENLGREDFPVKGGLCMVKGAHKIFVDPCEPVETRIEILARALSSFDTEEIYLRPFVREILEKAQRSSD